MDIPVSEQKVTAFWSLVRELEHDALMDWRALHGQGYSLGDALALYAEEVQTTVSRRIEGKHGVSVAVIGKSPHKSHDQYYIIERVGPDGYIIVEV